MLQLGTIIITLIFKRIYNSKSKLSLRFGLLHTKCIKYSRLHFLLGSLCVSRVKYTRIFKYTRITELRNSSHSFIILFLIRFDTKQ